MHRTRRMQKSLAACANVENRSRSGGDEQQNRALEAAVARMFERTQCISAAIEGNEPALAAWLSDKVGPAGCQDTGSCVQPRRLPLYCVL